MTDPPKLPTRAELKAALDSIKKWDLRTEQVLMSPRDYASIVGLKACPGCGYFPSELVQDESAYLEVMEEHFQANPECLQSHVHSV